MSGYYFECPACSEVTPISHPRNEPPYVERSCDHCGEEGCLDCIPNGLCPPCEDAVACEDGDVDDGDGPYFY